jgi:hypothetical protein
MVLEEANQRQANRFNKFIIIVILVMIVEVMLFYVS